MTRRSESVVDDAGRHEFRTVSSEDLYRGAIFAVRADRVAMPGGGVARRDVVEHNGAVAIAPLDSEGKLVMVHQYRHPLGRRLWELPAGLLDVPGEDAEATARRELAEETGLVAAQWSVLVEAAGSPGMSDEVVRLFLARGLSTVHRPVAEGDEETDLVIRRFPVAEAMRMVFSGEIVNGVTVAGVLATHAVLAGAAAPRPVSAPWIDRPTRFAARTP
ncbi:MAG: NUDIX domain-containing protein [Sciscionella sp.]